MLQSFGVSELSGYSIRLVTIHTRRDEEKRLIEIIRSFPVGRLTNFGGTLSWLVLPIIFLPRYGLLACMPWN